MAALRSSMEGRPMLCLAPIEAEGVAWGCREDAWRPLAGAEGGAVLASVSAGAGVAFLLGSMSTMG